jgi:unsaturated pyranuronate lyase
LGAWVKDMPQIKLDSLAVREIFPGLRARLIHSDRVTHSWVEVDSGATFPEHQHPHEQIVSVIEGELELVVNGVAHRLVPGVVFVIPPNVPHAGRGITACRVLDAFAPVREDYK